MDELSHLPFPQNANMNDDEIQVMDTYFSKNDSSELCNDTYKVMIIAIVLFALMSNSLIYRFFRKLPYFNEHSFMTLILKMAIFGILLFAANYVI